MRKAPQKLEIAGQRFGRLVAIERTRGRTAGLWLCECDCGRSKAIAGSALTMGRTKSCGCLHRERAAGLNYKHGLSETSLHRIWRGILNRCRNPNWAGFSSYGGRGIKVCDRWMDFLAFAEDMGAGYHPGLSIERIDVNGDYSPDNCRWATFAEQAVNRRATPFVVYEGVRMAFADAWRAANSPVRIDTAWSRYKSYGWSLDEALKTPALASGHRRRNNQCGNGHELSGNNVYVRPSNGRICCRTCINDAARRYRLRRAA